MKHGTILALTLAGLGSLATISASSSDKSDSDKVEILASLYVLNENTVKEKKYPQQPLQKKSREQKTSSLKRAIEGFDYNHFGDRIKEAGYDYAVSLVEEDCSHRPSTLELESLKENVIGYEADFGDDVFSKFYWGLLKTIADKCEARTIKYLRSDLFALPNMLPDINNIYYVVYNTKNYYDNILARKTER